MKWLIQMAKEFGCVNTPKDVILKKLEKILLQDCLCPQPRAAQPPPLLLQQRSAAVKQLSPEPLY